MGNPDDVQKAAPGLCHDLWQEGDGNVLIYGGDAQSLPDEIFLSKLKRLRSGQQVDGIIQVMSTSALPTDSERDVFLRCRQKADHLLGWQAPVWLWLTDKAAGAQQDAETAATGVIFGPEGTVKEAGKALTTLSQHLQKAGMAQILSNPAHDGLLQLSSRLRHELKTSLTVLLSGLMQGSAAWRLRGVMFSPELAVAGTVPNTRLDTPTWKAVIDDSDAVRGRKLGFNWLKMLRLILLSLIVLWGPVHCCPSSLTVPRFIRRRRRPGRQRILQNHWLNACAASSYSSKPLPVYNIMRLPVLRGTPDLVLIRTVTRWPHSGPCMRKTTHS